MADVETEISDTEGDFASASEGEDEPFDTNSTMTQRKESLKALEEPEVPKTAAPAAKVETPTGNSAWGGWSSFLSSAVSAVAESLQSDVDGLMTTARDLGEGLKKATEVSVDQVYTTLDPEYMKDQQKAHEKIESGDSENQNENDENFIGKVRTVGIVNSTESVLSAIDKTLDFTSDLLGNAVFTGYRTIESANLSKKVLHLRHQMMINQLGQAKVVNQSIVVGETLLLNGYTALEAIGSVIGAQAAQILGEQRVKLHETAEKKTEQRKRELTLADFFEDNCGNAHLQALEMLGTESSLKVSGFPSEKKDKHLKLFKDIEKNLDMDEMLENIEELDESVLSSKERFKNMLDLLGKLGVSNDFQLKALVKFLQEHSEKISEFEEKIKTKAVDNELQDLGETLKELKIWSLRAFSDFAEKSCEQTLRIAEIFLMLIAEDMLMEQKKEPSMIEERGLEFSKNLQKFSLLLLSELSLISTQFSNMSKSIMSGSNEGSYKPMLKEFQNELEQNTTTALSYLQEAVQSHVPILKLMILSATE